VGAYRTEYNREESEGKMKLTPELIKKAQDQATREQKELHLRNPNLKDMKFDFEVPDLDLELPKPDWGIQGIGCYLSESQDVLLSDVVEV
jgi:hypothetical protein